jgi:hypothetical protein
MADVKYSKLNQVSEAEQEGEAPSVNVNVHLYPTPSRLSSNPASPSAPAFSAPVPAPVSIAQSVVADGVPAPFYVQRPSAPQYVTPQPSGYVAAYSMPQPHVQYVQPQPAVYYGQQMPAIYYGQMPQQGTVADPLHTNTAPVMVPMSPVVRPMSPVVHLAAPPQQPPQGANGQIMVPPSRTPEQLEFLIANNFVDFRATKYISQAWQFVKLNIWTFVFIQLFWIAVFVVMGLLGNGMFGNHDFNTNNQGHHVVTQERWTLGLFIYQLLEYALVTSPMMAGCFAAVFKAMRNNEYLKFSDFFCCFQYPYYKRLLPLSLLLIGFRTLGMVLFVFPGVYFGIVSVFALPLHREHDFLSAWGAIKGSVRISHKQCCQLFGFLLLLGLLQLLGLVMLVVGLFVTVPMSLVATCYCYHHLVGINGVPLLITSAPLNNVLLQNQANPTAHYNLTRQQLNALPVALPVQPVQPVNQSPL